MAPGPSGMIFGLPPEAQLPWAGGKGSAIWLRMTTTAGAFQVHVTGLGGWVGYGSPELVEWLRDEINKRRRSVRGEVTVERLWGRIALRVAGVALVAVTVAWVVVR